MGSIIVLTVVAVAFAACANPPGSSPGPARSVAGSPGQTTTLRVEQEGHSQPFENGQAVAVGDAHVEIFVAPYPPLREGTIDLYVTDRVTGRPLEGALKNA